MEATKTRKRQRLTQGERATMQNDALDRAEHGRTCGNDLLILTAFAARGINATPRVDCFTFNAWRALNRHVKKGEHGVKIAAYAETEKEKDDGTTERHSYPTTAHVFHVSQTEPDEKPVQGVAITADGIAPCELSGDTVTLTAPLTPQEADTLDNIEATQRQDTDADEREQAEDDHEAAILEQEQREEASYPGPAYVIEDPLTGSIIGHSPAKVSRTSGSNDLSLF